MRPTLLMLVLAAGLSSGLDDPDPAKRKEAVAEWAQHNRPTPLPELPEHSEWMERNCRKVRAPRELHCDREAWLCRGIDAMGGSCHGRYSEEEQLTVVDGGWDRKYPMTSAAASTMIAYKSGTEDWVCAAELEDETTDERVAASCRKKLERDKQLAVKVECDVLLVNPCRRELYTRCHGQNARSAPAELKPGEIRVLRWKRGTIGPLLRKLQK